MNETVKLCAVMLLALFAFTILKDSKAEHPEVVVLFFGIYVMFRILAGTVNIVSFIKDIAEGTTVEGYLKILIKGAGITYITDFGSDLCKSANASTMAQYVEFAGRCELVLLSLPLVSELLEISYKMLNV